MIAAAAALVGASVFWLHGRMVSLTQVRRMLSGDNLLEQKVIWVAAMDLWQTDWQLSQGHQEWAMNWCNGGAAAASAT